MTLAAPAEVLSGAEFVVSGRVAPEAAGEIAIQVNRAEGWRTIARVHARRHRFKVGVTVTGEGTVRLRAIFEDASGQSIRSTSRMVRLNAASPPAGAAPSPGAPPAAPPATATTPVVPSEPSPEAAPESSASLTGAYWGAWIDGNPSPEDTATLRRFEGLAGKPLSILEAYSGWSACPSTCASESRFPIALFERIRAYGAIPLYSWASEAKGTVDDPDFSLAKIIAGTYDGYVRRWAEAAKAWGLPFFLRFDWEMNGNWFPWGEGVNGNEAGQYVAAWRHVHDIFSEVGATNVSWVWSPFANPNGNLPATSSFYPGDSYVDWTGIDGYNRGTSPGGTRWRTFAQIFTPDYEAITTSIAPSKPMLLPEVASSESGGSKAEWIAEMFAQLPTAFPAVRGLLWFDQEEGEHGWPIETSPSATEAFAAGVADPRYLTNSLGALPPGPVPVPTG